jgi:hypothetical protein
MTSEEITASTVTPITPLIAKDAKKNKSTLTTIGEATRFIRTNFSR